MKLKKLLNELKLDYGVNNWKTEFQQGKVYENPFHKAFAPIKEDDMEDAIHQVKTFDKPKGDKMLTIKVINRLKEKRNKSKSSSKRKELQLLIDKLEKDYDKGNYLQEVKNLYEVMKESFFNRKHMPQVKEDDLHKAIRKMTNLGISVKRGTHTPDSFKPSQKDIYKDKVDKILSRTTKSNVRSMKPLVVSEDNFIVDGHHRWKALLIKFPTERISYIKIGLPIKRAIQMYHKVADEI